MNKDKEIDFLGVGDIVTEPFIRIKDAEVTEDANGEHRELCLSFGDKIPYESAEVMRSVGNSPNASVSASRLGLNSYLISYLGEDAIGKENMESLVSNGVNIDYMETVPGMTSNQHYVLWFGVERTILVKHNEYPYSFPMNLPEPKWIYLSSLASNSTEYHNQITQYLDQHPNVKLAFQPGTFQMKMGTDILSEVYKNTDLFICNKEEYQRILKTEEEDVVKLMEMIRELGPKISVLTDGMKGAYASDGASVWFMPVYPHTPVERTGAGDAFGSTFLSALILGKTIPEALMWGPINSMSVVQKVGAQAGLLSREELEEFLANAPEEYKPSKLN